MVNLLESDKDIDEMYTYEVENQLKDPERGVLGSYILITKVEKSHYNNSTPSFLYETLEVAREDFYNPCCTGCGKKLGEDDKIYIGSIDYIDEFQHEPIYCEDCQQKQVTAEAL